MVLSRFSLKNKLFEMFCTNKKYMEAYQVGIGSGLVRNSIELLSENLLLKNLTREQGVQLNMLCKFLQAEHIATNLWPRTKEDGRIHKVLRAAVGSPQINSFVKMWEDINRGLDSSARRGTGVEMGKFRDMRTSGYVDILVCPHKMFMLCSPLTRLQVTRSACPNNDFRLPFDHIECMFEDLRIISSHGKIPYSAQLYCGIYEPPSQLGEHILLEWSPLRASSKQRLPPRVVDIESLRAKILRHIFGDVVPPLVSLNAGLRKIWSKKAEPQFPPLSILCRNNLRKSGLI